MNGKDSIRGASMARAMGSAAILMLALASGGQTAPGGFTAAQEGERPRPATVTVDFSVVAGPVKPMNAVNNGPVAPAGVRQHSNFDTFKAARIPFGRTHDTSEYIVFGGDHAVDISAVFPDFDADEARPENYDFAVTDAFLKDMRAAGTEPFYRLGQRIEHSARRYNVWPPKDFAKWARICEHVIRHYNEGWAGGFRWNIRYWEIWNEPDLVLDMKENRVRPKTWGGTPRQFFDFYETAAKHLKGRFPSLRIGGPGAAHLGPWCRDFLTEQKKRGTPIDFFSWHVYTHDPRRMAELAGETRALMDACGYPGAESILNEWNYVKGWKENYHYSIAQLTMQKGAAFTAAAMIACQAEPVDMLMYYDAMPDAHFNGVFDKTTLEPLKPYYALYSWGRLAMLGTSVAATADMPDIYAAAARHDDGRRAVFLARYAEDNNFTASRSVTVKLSGGAFPSEVSAHVTDGARMQTETTLWPASAHELTVQMPPNSFMLIEYGVKEIGG